MYTKYLFIDTERTGDDVTKNWMPCFGACIGDANTGKIFSSFSVYIKQHFNAAQADSLKGWDKQCLDEFWLRDEKMKAMRDDVIRKVDTVGRPQMQAMHMFHAWIKSHPEEMLRETMIITDTAGIDATFMNVYLGNADLPSLNYLLDDGYKYRVTRDSSSFHAGVGLMIPSRSVWGAEAAAVAQLRTRHAAIELDLDANPYVADHDPENDAKHECWTILQIHRAIAALDNKQNQ
jgi:hypothetical protein